MKIVKRTFEANHAPNPSRERVDLNCHARTSEYMPSYRYMLIEEDGRSTPFMYRTKNDAIQGLANRKRDGDAL